MFQIMRHRFFFDYKFYDMKKKIILLLIGLTFSTVKAQQISDALQYSNDDLTGTARYQAMSGAFGALGGDLSAIQVNFFGHEIILIKDTTLDNDTIRVDKILYEKTHNESFYKSKINRDIANILFHFFSFNHIEKTKNHYLL